MKYEKVFTTKIPAYVAALILIIFIQYFAFTIREKNTDILNLELDLIETKIMNEILKPKKIEIDSLLNSVDVENTLLSGVIDKNIAYTEMLGELLSENEMSYGGGE